LPRTWFRRHKAGDELAPSTAATQVVEPDPPIVVAPVAVPSTEVTSSEPGSDAEGQPTSTAPRKRRRGNRGGRGRSKRPAGAGAGAATADGAEDTADENDAVAPSVEKPAKEQPERKRGERKPRERSERSDRSRTPRRQPPRRAPLPNAKRELLISVDAGEKRVAILEDDVVAEVYLERPEHRSIAGNVYLGTVDNVLPGMEAAFVEIGLEKNGFLYVDEIVGPELEGRRGARKIQDLIQKGQTILVQAVKDPMKTKGARLTTEISLPGRFVVYVPHGDGLGVSRRLEDDERNRLKTIVKEIAPKDGGVIVRTAAEGASAEDVARDLDFLIRLWETIETRAKKTQAPALVYQEAELPLRVTRDLFTGDFERLLVDHDRTYKRIVGYLKKTSPHMVDRVTRYKEREPLLESFGVEQEIRSTLSRRVDLPSGGYLVFDYAEAFTVIDVNTGRFVGSRSKQQGAGRLEDTITKNNLEAVKEVVRQLRLRDVGGIIVIDFIDMANPKNRAQVEEALRTELERDRTKTYVVEISPLGLVEMTRQNVTDGPREVMTRKCPTCDGDGIIVSESTTAVEIERKLRALVTPGSRAKAFKVELSAKVAALLIGPAASRLIELEEITKRRFFFVPVPDVHLDHFRVVGQGGIENQQPVAPIEVGQEYEVKLGEIGLHDPRAGAAKIKSFDVVIDSAAKLVGKKVRVRICAVMDGVAYADVVDPGARIDSPITAEAEAERPTRPARRAVKKAADGVQEAAGLAADDDLDVVEAVSEDAAADVAAPARRPASRRSSTPRQPAEAAAEDGAVADGETPAPKPRRPRRPAAATAAAAAEEADGEEVEAADGVEVDGEAVVPKKRTRRGTRGGRNRKRKPAGVAVDGESDAEGDTSDSTAPVAVPARNGESDGESEAPAGPVIHMPGREIGDAEGDGDGTAPAARKQTRRGSRGGRNRKPRAAVSAVDGEVSDDAGTDVEATEVAVAEVAAPVAASADEVPAAPARPARKPAKRAPTPAKKPESDDATTRESTDDWSYTPMSEWNLDASEG